MAWTGSSADRMGRRLQPKQAWGPRRETAMMIGAWAFREPASQKLELLCLGVRPR